MTAARIAVLVAGLALSACAAPLLSEPFEGSALPAGWTVDASEGASVRVEGGALRVRAALNTFAHIERALPADRVGVTVRLSGSEPRGISWAAGVFLYWAPDSWLEFGVIDPGGGRFYTAEASGAAPVESYLTPCGLAEAQWLRVELAEDCIRYLSRREGSDAWVLERAIRRPLEWRAAPSLLVLGKGFGMAGGDYPAPDLDNDYPDRGEATECAFDDLTIEPLSTDRLRARPGELAPRGDTIGELLLAAPGDPTYEQVAAVYPGMRHTREAVGPAWHTDEIAVDETGALELVERLPGGELRVVHATVVPVGVPLTKSLVDGHLPVVRAEWETAGLAWRQTVIGWSEGLRQSEPVSALVRLEARSRDGQAHAEAIRWALTPQPAGWRELTAALDVPAGGEASACFEIPYSLSAESRGARVGEERFASALEQLRGWWRGYLARGMQVQVPDERILDGIAAWLAYNAIDVDTVEGYREAHDGSGFYEAVFAYSAARYAWVLDLWGRHDEAEEVLRTLRKGQGPDGLLDWNFGLTDTGAYLWAVAEHYRLTGDDAWLRDYAPSIASACEWIRKRRAETRVDDPKVAGLLEHRSYCDYPEPVYGYLHNAFCVVGMERVAEAMALCGLQAEARPIATEAASYRVDIERSMAASAIVREGRRILPMEPDTHRLLRAVGYDSRDYYGLVASMLLESGILAPDSSLARDVRSFLREAGGIRLGTCEFVGGIDHAYGYGYLEQELATGAVERWLLGLYTALAYGMTRETFSSVECTQPATGDNALTLPHLYSGSHQLLSIRTMLLREEGAALHLLSGVPRAWLEDGKSVSVAGAPTRFGVVDLEATSSLRDGTISVRLSRRPVSATQDAPAEYSLHLRHPDGRPIRGVTVNGRAWREFDAESVRLPGASGPLTIEVRYDR